MLEVIKANSSTSEMCKTWRNFKFNQKVNKDLSTPENFFREGFNEILVNEKFNFNQ